MTIAQRLQLALELGRALEAVVAAARERLVEHLVEPLRQRGAELARGARFGGQDLQQERVVVRGRERALPGERFVQDDSAGVEIDPRVEVSIAPRLLGRHVKRSPHDHPGAREIEVLVLLVVDGADHLRHAEVEELRERRAPDALREEDVLRLDVAVDDPLLVRRDEPRKDLGDDFDHVVERKAPFALDSIRHRLADEALHDEVRAPVVEGPEVVDLADVGVADRAGRARFLVEALHGDLLSRLRGVEHLHRDAAPERHVLRLVDGAHPPLAEDRANQVLPADRPSDQIAVRLARRHRRGERLRLRGAPGRGGSSDAGGWRATAEGPERVDVALRPGSSSSCSAGARSSCPSPGRRSASCREGARNGCSE